MSEEKITYNSGGVQKTVSDCPFWDYKTFSPFRVVRGIAGTGYCRNPLSKEEIECHYGESEIRVPKNCPLRAGKLEIELIEE